MQSAAKACGSVREIPGRAEALERLAALFRSGNPASVRPLLVLVDEATLSLESGDEAAADRLLYDAFASLFRWAPPETSAFRWSATALLLLVPAAVPAPEPPGRSRIFPCSSFRDCRELVRAMDSWVGRSLF